MCGNEKENADIIPVDIVSNALIASAAYRTRLKFNFVSIKRFISFLNEDKLFFNLVLSF